MTHPTTFLPVCRHRQTDVQFTVFKEYKSLSVEQKFFLESKGGIFGSAGYFNRLGALPKEVLRSLFVSVMKGKKELGILYFQLVPFEGKQLENFIPSAMGPHLQRPVKRILSGFKTNLLVAGNIFMTGDTGIYFRSGIDLRKQAEAYVEAVKFLLNHEEKPGAFLISDLYGPETEFDHVLKAAGFRKTRSEPDMEMSVPAEWKNFDDYLAALSTKYRTRVKRTMAKTTDYIQNRLDAAQIAACETKIHSLYRQVTDQVKLKLATLETGYFSAQKAIEPDKYHVFCYSKDEEIQGLMTYFINDSRLEVHHTGRDKQTTTDVMLYERMLLDAVAFGLECGVKSIHFGRTATEVKSTIGATPKEMHGYVFHTKTIRNQLFAFMARTLKPQPFTLRNPFKNKNTEK